MERITLTGHLGPSQSFELDTQLRRLTAVVRPSVTVDLSDVHALHPSVVSVLVRCRRQARRQGGDVVFDRARSVGRQPDARAHRTRHGPSRRPPVVKSASPDTLVAEPVASIGRASVLLTGAMLAASGVNYALNLFLARTMTPSEFGDANLIVTVMLGLTAVAVTLQLVTAQRVSTARVQNNRHSVARCNDGHGAFGSSPLQRSRRRARWWRVQPRAPRPCPSCCSQPGFRSISPRPSNAASSRAASTSGTSPPPSSSKRSLDSRWRPRRVVCGFGVRERALASVRRSSHRGGWRDAGCACCPAPPMTSTRRCRRRQHARWPHATPRRQPSCS